MGSIRVINLEDTGLEAWNKVRSQGVEIKKNNRGYEPTLHACVHVRSQVVEGLLTYLLNFKDEQYLTPWWYRDEYLKASKIRIHANVRTEEKKLGDGSEKEWDELFNERGWLALIGDSGSGKTFLTKKSMGNLAEKKIDDLEAGKESIDQITIPIWVTAAELAATHVEDVKTALLTVLKKQFNLSDQLVNWFKDKLQIGKVWLVLDALDEVTEKKDIETLQVLAGKLVSKDSFALSHLTLTCRTMDWQDHRYWLVQGKFTEATLEPFKQFEQNKFIDKFFRNALDLAKNDIERNLVKEGLQKLTRRLENHHQLQQACTTPLLLTFVCLLYLYGEVKDDTAYTTLFRLTAEKILSGEWRGKKSFSMRDRTKETERNNELIGAMACALFEIAPAPNWFTLHQWRQAAKKAGVKKDEKLRSRLEEVGMLVYSGRDHDGYSRWSFAHRIFLELFAALGLWQQKEVNEKGEPSWLSDSSEIVRFLAELVPDRNSLFDFVAQKGD